jgi:hypothetical protein
MDTSSIRITECRYSYDEKGRVKRIKTNEMGPGFYSYAPGRDWVKGELSGAEIEQLKNDEDVFDYIMSKHSIRSRDWSETEITY